jgi:predicted acylesterase/phospholipase RssA
MISQQSRFDSVVLAGGGSRCFWHAGFWREVQEPLALAPRQIAAVSAAGAIACALNAGIGEEALRLFQAATRMNPRNFYPRNVFGPDPVFPHERMYRKAVLELFDAASLARVHAGPDIRMLLGHAPRWLGPRAGVLAAAAAYNFDKRVRRIVHPTTSRTLGFRPEVVSVRECATPEALSDLILASSCSPPMTSLLKWNGRYVLDGGVVDNVPVCALDNAPGETLVLLTRRYAALPDVPGRTYVQPSAKLAVGAWDYTSAEGLQSAYDTGRRDGEAFRSIERR